MSDKRIWARDMLKRAISIILCLFCMIPFSVNAEEVSLFNYSKPTVYIDISSGARTFKYYITDKTYYTEYYFKPNSSGTIKYTVSGSAGMVTVQVCRYSDNYESGTMTMGVTSSGWQTGECKITGLNTSSYYYLKITKVSGSTISGTVKIYH